MVFRGVADPRWNDASAEAIEITIDPQGGRVEELQAMMVFRTPDGKRGADTIAAAPVNTEGRLRVTLRAEERTVVPRVLGLLTSRRSSSTG